MLSYVLLIFKTLKLKKSENPNLIQMLFPEDKGIFSIYELEVIFYRAQEKWNPTLKMKTNSAGEFIIS